jgi:8-oxoguanine deaminase
MRTLLSHIGRLYTCDRHDRVLADAYVVVEGERIVEVGQGRPEGHFDQRIDLRGQVVIPGLVNLHHHFFQTLTRAIPRALSGHLIDWLRAMYPLWAGFTPEDLNAATQATMAELMLTGATTSVDHAYLMPGGRAAYTDAIVEGARTAGMRLHLVRGCMTVMEDRLEQELTPLIGPRAGGLVDDEDEVLADMARAIDTYHDTGWGARVTIALGPTTATYPRLDFMRRIAGLANEHGCALHMHFHPRPDERAWCREQYGKRPIELLDEAGWLRPGTWFAHSTRVDADDMRQMAEAGVAVAHCPRMIVRLGARVTPVHEMLAAGVRVGFGVDGGASNDSSSMLGELRLALLLHRVAGGEGTVPWQQWLSPYRALTMATRDAAAVLGRSDIGRIELGCCADIAAFDMSPVAFAGARTDWLSGLLVAGDDSRASLTMIGGAIRVLHGRLVWDDEQQLRARVDAATQRLIERAQRLTGLDYLQMA